MTNNNLDLEQQSPTRYQGHLAEAQPLSMDKVHSPEAIPMRHGSMDKPIDNSGGHTGYAGYYPEDLPARPLPTDERPWRQFMKRFWTFSLSSYSVTQTPDGAARIRHICMIIILTLRTASSGLSIFAAITKGKIAETIIYSLLAVLGLWFTATCLAIIGDAPGNTRIRGFLIVSSCPNSA